LSYIIYFLLHFIGVLFKKNKIGKFKEKYFSLTKDFFLYIDLKNKNKKMRVLDLFKCTVLLLPQKNEYNLFEVRESKKIYHLKANNQNDMKNWFYIFDSIYF
jgi:hypothetical protein